MFQVCSLKDIASEAGCSINTVSLALKNSPRISKENRGRIQEIAKRLNYVSNNMARALVLKKTGIVGLIIRSISSPLLTSVARYIEQFLEQQGYTMYMVASHDNPEIEAKLINLMLSNGMDGIIVNTSMVDNLPRLEALRDHGLPVVLISGFETAPAIDSVFPDLGRGAYVAAAHLLSLGHQRVVYVTGAAGNCVEGNLKLNGVQQAMADAGRGGGAPEGGSICYLDMHNSRTIDDESLLSFISRAKNETAFFVSNDELAIILIKILHHHGIRVPRDIAIASIDNIHFAETCMVPLTTAGFPIRYIAQQAVDMLVDCIEEKAEPGKFQNIRVPPELFVRESCGYLT